MIIYTGTLTSENLFLMPVILLLLLVSSTIWGGMLNIIFMFSRDASIIMNILDTPMTLFSGTRVPVSSFPQWAKIVSLIFPLTYCINLIRFVFSFQKSGEGWLTNLAGLIICLIVMIVISLILVK